LLINKINKLKTTLVVTFNILLVIFQSRKKTIVVAYDYYCSPLTYGDLFYVIMLIRVLNSGFQKKIKLVFILDKIRKDWQNILKTEKNIQVRHDNLVEMSCGILRGFVKIETINYFNFQQKYLIKKKSYSIFCRSNVCERKPFYNAICNSLSIIYSLLHPSVKKLYFLSAEDLNISTQDIPNYEYISWGLRFNPTYRIEANLNDDEFIKIHNYLRNKFPLFKIMVVSDENGCAHFKSVAKKHNLECLFSNDKSHSFLNDAFIVLNSSHYFQLYGTGLSVIPLFSKIPYTKIFPTTNNNINFLTGFASWSLPSQKYIKLAHDQRYTF